MSAGEPRKRHAVTAENDSATTQQDVRVRIDVLANDTDTLGHPLSAEIGDLPSNGSASVGAGGVTYVPDGDFSGTDTFTYRATDGDISSEYAVVTVTVEASPTVPSTESSATTSTPASADPTTAAAATRAPSGIAGAFAAIGKTIKGLVSSIQQMLSTKPAQTAAMCLMPLAIMVLVAGMAVRRLRDLKTQPAEDVEYFEHSEYGEYAEYAEYPDDFEE